MLNVGKKLLLARGLRATGLGEVMLRGQKWWLSPRHIRMINYHGTPERLRESFARHLDYYEKRFVCATYEGLLGLIERGEWAHDRPGLLVSFDDGLRSNAEVAAQMLEERGWHAWFFLAPAFIDTPVNEQRAFTDVHDIIVREGDADATGRLAMTWEQVRGLRARGHVIGHHTRNHTRLTSKLTDEQIAAEIHDGRSDLETRLGEKVESFCYVGGEEWTYDPRAAALVKREGFKLAFMTGSCPATHGSDPLQLHRTNVEVDWPMELMQMFLSGVGDLVHIRKRQRVRESLGAAGT